MRIQPSSTVIAKRGEITSFDSRAIALALDKRLVPLIHGDIALDEMTNGKIVSTRPFFSNLVGTLQVRRIILLGEVEGVFDRKGNHYPYHYAEFVRRSSYGACGIGCVDVTGGMRQKVETMIDIVREYPGPEVTIADGRRRTFFSICS